MLAGNFRANLFTKCHKGDIENDSWIYRWNVTCIQTLRVRVKERTRKAAGTHTNTLSHIIYVKNTREINSIL